MKSKGIMSWPSWSLSLLTLIVTTIALFIISEVFLRGRENGNAVTIITTVIYVLAIVVCCFFIVKKNLSSFWYVPLICNALTIITAFSEDFWKGPDWIFICSGWVLSIVASIIGAIVGKRTAISDNSQSPNNLSEV